MSEIELTLKEGDHTDAFVSVGLEVSNHSEERILIPYPSITDLKFVDQSGAEAEWYVTMFVSSTWSGLTLEPQERRSISFHVRPRNVDLDADDDPDFRWFIDIHPGFYTVTFSMRVDTDYFDGDSHYQFPNVEREAQRLSAHAWSGSAESNTIKIEHRTSHG